MLLYLSSNMILTPSSWCSRRCEPNSVTGRCVSSGFWPFHPLSVPSMYRGTTVTRFSPFCKRELDTVVVVSVELRRSAVVVDAHSPRSTLSHPRVSSWLHCWQVIGVMAMDCCSSHTMNRFPIIGDTGLPVTVPNVCRNTQPEKLKYVVVTTNVNSSTMSPTHVETRGAISWITWGTARHGIWRAVSIQFLRKPADGGWNVDVNWINIQYNIVYGSAKTSKTHTKTDLLCTLKSIK